MQKIMFNDRYGLTDAVLSGRKTMTRRIIPNEFFSLTWDFRGNTLVYENAEGDFIDIRNSKYCLYKLGEVVAVAQSYYDAFGMYPNSELSENGTFNKMFVRADLMPHQIRITGIRIERLQDITDESCLREGIEFHHDAQSYYVDYRKQTGYMAWLGHTPREAFAALIDKVSGRGTWESNPYVVVYEFELVK